MNLSLICPKDITENAGVLRTTKDVKEMKCVFKAFMKNRCRAAAVPQALPASASIFHKCRRKHILLTLEPVRFKVYNPPHLSPKLRAKLSKD